MERVIGVDLDGVVCDFNRGYRKALIDASGRDLFIGETDPPCWNYAQAYGYSKDEDTAAWKHMTASSTFWASLRPLPGVADFLFALDASTRFDTPPARVYFITSRPGIDAKGQSERWLQSMGYECPTVLIVGVRAGDVDKGLLASALGLTHFIDDKPENVLAVKGTRGSACQVYCPQRRYNEREQPWLRAKGVVTGDLPEFSVACGLRPMKYAA